MRDVRRCARCLVVVWPLLLCGCDQVRGSLPRQDDSRYELRQDAQGRTIRLDKVTGEVAIVQGERLIAVKPSNEASNPSSERRLRAAPTPERATTQRSDATAVAPVGAPITYSQESGPPVAGSPVTITSRSPVFATANQNQTPLEVLEKGVVGKLMEAEGEWYLIEFQSPRWGPRVGFVERKSAFVGRGQRQVAPAPQGLEPMDLSVPDPKRLEPMDLSVPSQK